MSSRIAFDITPLLYQGGGIRRCTETLLNSLLERSSDLEFILFGRRLGGPRIDRRGGKVRRGVRLRLPRSAEPLIQMLGLVEAACRADLYHATDFYMPLKSANRAVATIHDLIFLRNPEPIVDHARLARRAGRFAGSCRAIIACSQWTKQEIVQILKIDPGKIHVVYWGVDHQTFYPQADGESPRERLAENWGIRRPYFLAVSCSVHRKNTPRLIAAFRRLLREGASNDLVLVWTAPAKIQAEYQREISEGRIRFTGRVSDAQLRDLYAGATAMIYPSLDEGFGLPMLEAMSCGTPVIVSNASCLPEVAGDAAIYVDPISEQSIADAMGRFENHESGLMELRERGIQRAAEFTWERCAQQTLDVYQTSLAST